MRRPSRARLPALAAGLAALFLGLFAAPGADARPGEVTGEIEFEVRLEPADLAPGGDGTLVVTSVIADRLHVYADGLEALAWRPLPVEGVTYHAPASPGEGLTWETFEKDRGRVTWTKPKWVPDPGYPEGDPVPVWDEGYDFEIRVPVTLAATVSPTARLGLVLAYSACDEKLCYARVKEQLAAVSLGAAAPAPPASPAPSPAESPAVSPAEALTYPTEEVEDEAARVTLEVREEDGETVAVVTFIPHLGFHLYQPGASGSGDPVAVEPLDEAGLSWDEDWFYDEEGSEFEEPYEVHLPFVRKDAKRLRVRVRWQGCSETGCERPQTGVLEARWGAAPEPAAPVEPPPPMVPPGGEGGVEEAPPAPPPVEGKVLVRPSAKLPFPVVYGDDLDQPRRDDDWEVRAAAAAPLARPGSDLEQRWESSWILFLGTVFLFGVGLAFTPCVLPIIPLTISVIGGGNPNVSRPRLTLLLSVYVLGLSLTYGLAGAASGALGEAVDVEAAFRIPLVIWSIVGIFLLLAAGMLGVFEMQPPAWMERLRGGAAQRSGTIVGSFLLGILAAFIASPCTGPFVVGMLTFVATTQNPLIGFVLFFSLGLGMGAVFFAAGSLNLLARPGPWMVWVRYAFGILLVGVALYFLANAGLVPPWGLFALGFGLAVLGWLAVTRQLVVREGESLERARVRGAALALLMVVATGAAAYLARVPAMTGAGSVKLAVVLGLSAVFGLATWFLLTRARGERSDEERRERKTAALRPVIGIVSLLVVATAVYAHVTRPVVAGPEGWIKLKDVAHLRSEVARATQEERPVVIDVWATWCTYCKAYDRVIERDPYLRQAFEDMVRLKIDVETDKRADLRRAVGLGGGQPLMAFFDEEGRIRRAADILEWHGDEAGAELRKRVDFLFRRTSTESAHAGR